MERLLGAKDNVMEVCLGCTLNQLGDSSDNGIMETNSNLTTAIGSADIMIGDIDRGRGASFGSAVYFVESREGS